MAMTSRGAAARRVLIVDDQANMRRTMAAVLRDEGCEVAAASTGEEAIQLCSDQSFDVVLMDVRMSGIDGVEALRRIRRQGASSRIILMSAYSFDALKHTALDEGAVAFLIKPLDLREVLRLIQEVEEGAVLVVEKDEATADRLSAELRRRGYRVTIARSARQAIELVEQIRFDIAFMDLDLPGMNGLELYLTIREAAPSLIAVMIAEARGGWEAMARQAICSNAYAAVERPLDMDRVVALLKRIAADHSSNARRKPRPNEP